MFDYGQCGWKDRRGKRCGRPAVAVRDLGPAYGKLRMQYVCTQHAGITHPGPAAVADEPEDLRDATRWPA